MAIQAKTTRKSNFQLRRLIPDSISPRRVAMLGKNVRRTKAPNAAATFVLKRSSRRALREPP